MNNAKYGRRAFMRTLGMIGAGAALIPSPAMAVVRLVNEHQVADHQVKVAETRFLMGTFVTITAVNESRTRAEQAIGLAFNEIERLSDILDRHRSDTPISHLNASGVLNGAAPELSAVLGNALAYNRLTAGAFDATVLPLVHLLREDANPSGRMHVDKKALHEALSLVDSSAVRVSGQDIRLGKAGMGVTLDGMGKGYIVDRASDVLAENGVGDHLINAGGDMRARGQRSPGCPWTIAIEDPKGHGNYPAIIQLSDAAVATSGGYEVAFDASRSHHHVVDPRTAMSPTRSISVSVTAPTVMQADALATAVFVMPPHDGANLVESMSRCECLVIGNTGAKLTSRGWGRLVKA